MSTASALSLPPATETLIAQLWPDFSESRLSLRQVRTRLKTLGPRLGLLLEALQSELAGTGRDGEFRPFLRRHHIPTSTAYALIRRFGTGPAAVAARNKKAKVLKYPLNTSPEPLHLGNGIVLNGNILSLPFSARQTHLFRRSMADLARPETPAFNLAEVLVHTLIQHTSSHVRGSLEAIFMCKPLRHEPDLPSHAALRALPPLRIELGQRGFDYCMTGDPH